MLYEHGNNDYYDFYNSFNGEGFSLLINLAEGGVMPGTNTGSHFIFQTYLILKYCTGTHDTFVDGQPQYMKVSSAKVYGF